MRKEKSPKAAGSLERVALRVCSWAGTRMGTERVCRLIRPHRFWRPACVRILLLAIELVGSQSMKVS